MIARLITVTAFFAGLVVGNIGYAATHADDGSRYEPSARSARQDDPVERWRPLLAQYDWPIEQAMAVLRCENDNGNPTRLNEQGSDAKGLMMLLGWEWKAHELYGPNASVLDPAVNIGVAYWIWRESGRTFGTSMGWLASKGCWGQ